MDAGKDKTMIDIHERAMNRIGDVLIEFQDETIRRMSDALEHAEEIARNALIPCTTCGGSGFSRPGSGYDAVCDDCTGGYVGYATGEMVNDLSAQLATAQAEMRHACDLAGIVEGNANTLTDWIVGAQSEIAGLAASIEAMRNNVAEIERNRFERTAPLDWRESEQETPYGQMLDCLGDEVEP